MNEGYIALWRKLRDNPLWTEHRRFSRAEAWIDLLMDAHWQDDRVLLGTKFILVKRGQVLFSQRKKATQWGWARNSVHTFLSMLKDTGMVSHEVSHGPEGGFTLVTILKFDEYQPSPGRGWRHQLSHDLSQRRATIEPAIEPRSEPRFEPPKDGCNAAPELPLERRAGNEVSHDLSHGFDEAHSDLEHREEVIRKRNTADVHQASAPGSAGGNGRSSRRRKTDPETDTLLQEFSQRFETKLGEPYLIEWGRDRKLMDGLVTTYGAASVRAKVAAFFEHGTAATRERRAWTVPEFRRVFPQLIGMQAMGDLT